MTDTRQTGNLTEISRLMAERDDLQRRLDGQARDCSQMIRVAQDLLAALQEIVNVYESGTGSCLDLRMSDIARAAISKAAGRDS